MLQSSIFLTKGIPAKHKYPRLIACAQQNGLQDLLPHFLLDFPALQLAACGQCFGKVTFGAVSGEGAPAALFQNVAYFVVNRCCVELVCALVCPGSEGLPFSWQYELLLAGVCVGPRVAGAIHDTLFVISLWSRSSEVEAGRLSEFTVNTEPAVVTASWLQLIS
jgi:hypothetical protein